MRPAVGLLERRIIARRSSITWRKTWRYVKMNLLAALCSRQDVRWRMPTKRYRQLSRASLVMLPGPISMRVPVIAMGNTVIVIPSQQSPLSATDCYQVFETSDLPDGVVNIVTGERDALCQVLADHEDVDAMWYFGSVDGSK